MKHVPTVKEKDKAVIMNVVRRYGPLSRVDIHELTRLRPASISLLVRELMEERQLVEVGPADNPSGRKRILLGLNKEFGFIVGVDFDAEFVEAAVMNLHPEVKSLVSEPTVLDKGIGGLVEQLLSCAQKAIEKAGIDPSSVLGVGVGDPGLVNSREGISIMSSTIEFWKKVPLKQLFEDKFGIRTLVGNNTRTKTVAERVMGAGEMAEDMIFVEYGKGIGAGIITSGKVLQGHRWSAGEFGHSHIMENGPACKCGSFGCLEAIASVGALEMRIRKAILEGGFSQSLTLAGADVNKITGWTVLEGAKQGDKLCSAIVEELGRHLGLGLANLVNLFNPSLVVLDQRLELAGQPLLEQITRVVKRQALGHSTEDLLLCFGKLGREAGVLGAGLLVLERLFEVPLLKPPKFMVEGLPAPFAPGKSRKQTHAELGGTENDLGGSSVNVHRVDG